MRRFYPFLTILALLTWLGCNGSNPTKPSGSHNPLAGGGRLENNDPVTGNKDSLGQDFPIPDPYPYPYLVPIYSSDRDCAENPQRLVISDSASWRAWWDEVAGCQWRGQIDPSTDSTIIDTVPCDGRCATDPPFVDFDAGQVVVAISIEKDSGDFCMRSVWVQSVESGAQGTTIRYEVSRLDATCCSMLMRPMMIMGWSPVVAVIANGPLTGPIEWARNDTTYTCPGPDPNEPMTLHYTSTPCELGSPEQIIRDSARWQEWFETAIACDTFMYATFPYDGPMPWDSVIGVPEEDSLIPSPPDSTFPDPYPWWGTPYVDFTQFAVLILRAGEQTRWGGGIWLEKISRDGGTTISYTVMVPDDECPEMGMMAVNPTVAIRVPLPLNEPINWLRSEESIGCGWVTDSSWVDSTGMIGPK